MAYDYPSTMRPKMGGKMGMKKSMGKGAGAGHYGFGYSDGMIKDCMSPQADHERTHDASTGMAKANRQVGYDY